MVKGCWGKKAKTVYALEYIMSFKSAHAFCLSIAWIDLNLQKRKKSCLIYEMIKVFDSMILNEQTYNYFLITVEWRWT